jgi:hypothetical protein
VSVISLCCCNVTVYSIECETISNQILLSNTQHTIYGVCAATEPVVVAYVNLSYLHAMNVCYYYY